MSRRLGTNSVGSSTRTGLEVKGSAPPPCIVLSPSCPKTSRPKQRTSLSVRTQLESPAASSSRTWDSALMVPGKGRAIEPAPFCPILPEPQHRTRPEETAQACSSPTATDSNGGCEPATSTTRVNAGMKRTFSGLITRVPFIPAQAKRPDSSSTQVAAPPATTSRTGSQLPSEHTPNAHSLPSAQASPVGSTHTPPTMGRVAQTVPMQSLVSSHGTAQRPARHTRPLPHSLPPAAHVSSAGVRQARAPVASSRRHRSPSPSQSRFVVHSLRHRPSKQTKGSGHSLERAQGAPTESAGAQEPSASAKRERREDRAGHMAACHHATAALATLTR
jgi:hypothetical protein